MSLRKAINAKCKDCIYDNCSPGTWREQVEACTSTDCGLYPVRPRSRPKIASKVRSEAESTFPKDVDSAPQVIDLMDALRAALKRP